MGADLLAVGYPQLLELTGDAQLSGSLVQLAPKPGWPVGTAKFALVQPAGLTKWLAGELTALLSRDDESCLLRLYNERGEPFYFDELQARWVKVTVAHWLSQASLPYHLANLDVWPWAGLQLQIQLKRTKIVRWPRIELLRLLFEQPGAHGTLDQVLQAVMGQVKAIRPILRWEETAQAPLSQWDLGLNERNYRLTAGEALVDGQPRQVTVNGSVVQLVGPPARTGQLVQLVLRHQPTDPIVRRGFNTVGVHQTPAWIVQDILDDQSGDQAQPAARVGTYEVGLQQVQQRLLVRGIASRLEDALGMRDALQAAFQGMLLVTLASSRVVALGSTEKAEIKAGTGTLPEAQLRLSFTTTEVTSLLQVRPARASDGSQLVTDVIYQGTVPNV